MKDRAETLLLFLKSVYRQAQSAFLDSSKGPGWDLNWVG